MKYMVVVGNIGTVYRGNSREAALESYKIYKDLSHRGVGRAAGEHVTLCDGKTGEPIKEYFGADGE